MNIMFPGWRKSLCAMVCGVVLSLMCVSCSNDRGAGAAANSQPAAAANPQPAVATHTEGPPGTQDVPFCVPSGSSSGTITLTTNAVTPKICYAKEKDQFGWSGPLSSGIVKYAFNVAIDTDSPFDDGDMQISDGKVRKVKHHDKARLYHYTATITTTIIATGVVSTTTLDPHIIIMP